MLTCRLILIAIIATLVFGCGKKGPLRPLGEPIPQAPKQVSLSQQGDGLVLSWNAADKNEDGSAAQLAGFRIYRLPYAPENECPECRDDDRLWREVPTGDFGENFRLLDDQVISGQGYRYRIEPLTDAGFPGSSALASRVVIEPPPQPVDVKAIAEHGQVNLSWSTPGSSGGELDEYKVYRTTGENPFPLQSLNQRPLTVTEYEDVGLMNGTTYRYQVSALWKFGEIVVESERSEPISATPRSAFEK